MDSIPSAAKKSTRPANRAGQRLNGGPPSKVAFRRNLKSSRAEEQASDIGTKINRDVQNVPSNVKEIEEDGQNGPLPSALAGKRKSHPTRKRVHYDPSQNSSRQQNGLREKRAKQSSGSNQPKEIKKYINRDNSKSVSPTQRIPQKDRGDTTPEKIKTQIYASLDMHTTIPWNKMLRPGYGIDAITWKPKDCALDSPPKYPNERTPTRKKTRYRVITKRDTQTLRDGFGLNAGASSQYIAPSALLAESKVKFSQLLSNSASSETFLVQCELDGEYGVEYHLNDLKLANKALSLSTSEFREQYGDYFIAGYQKYFRFELFILCETSKQTSIDVVDAKVTARFQEIFQSGFKRTDKEARAKTYRILTYWTNEDGCSADRVSRVLDTATGKNESDLLTAAAVILERVRITKPRTELVYLQHYCTVNAKIHRGIEGVSDELLARNHDLRRYCNELRSLCGDSALKLRHKLRDNIDNELKTYERTLVSQSLVSAKGVIKFEKMYRKIRVLHRISKNFAARYDFIKRIADINTAFKFRPPTGNIHVYEWECGQTGGHPSPKDTQGTSRYHSITLDDMEVFRAKWTSSWTKTGIFGFRKVFMEFRSTSSHSAFPPESNSQSTAEQQSLLFQLEGGPAYVLGWKLWAKWKSQLGRRPEITVRDPEKRNCILSEDLCIEIDSWVSALWKCEVTFVFKRDFDFPIPRSPQAETSDDLIIREIDAKAIM
ncbi:hypothetical protein VNI00_015780 [Paramarasmius palmivorus]|uniref:Uncharacterized protein n=1 Tax=Paramarasmius palmivorus TaxID=297713 RepID=A0AAW0BJ25_9AGAR